MSSIATPALQDIEVLRSTARMADATLRTNVEGIGHEESLQQPAEGANCLNWVVGHLACVHNNAAQLLGQKPVRDKAVLQRYDRGSKPVVNESDALDFNELLAIWDEAQKRVEAGLNSLTAAQLDSPAPFSPTKNPNETVRSLLATLFFHQAYHAGQTGVLRRLVGKSGAIK